MAAGIKNIVIEQGTDFDLLVTLINPQTKLPIDLSGYTFQAQIRESYQSTSIVQTFTIDNTNYATGKILMKLTNAETSALKGEKTFFYDLEGTDLLSKKFRVIQGTVYISPEVTR